MKLKLAAAVVAAFAVALPSAFASGEHEVDMEDFAFRPARLVVRPGILVTWKNRDRAPHNATSYARRDGRRLFRTRTIRLRGTSTARAPRTRGTYRYFCTVHPNMRGVLVVR
jgi:plastocyanin